MKKHLLSVLIILSGGFGCASHPAPTTAPAPLTAAPAGSFIQHWANNIQLNGDSVDRLFVRDNTVFAYTHDFAVYAISRSGGEIQYSTSPTTSGATLRAPLVIGDRVVYPSGSTIDVFNDRGRPVRVLDLQTSTSSGAIGESNIVYIGLHHTSGMGVLAQLDLNQPYKIINWEMLTPGIISAAPAMYDKVIYCGSEDGRLYAINEERQPIWSLPGGVNWFQTQGRFVSDIKAEDSGVYAANTDTKLYCLDRMTGKIKWLYYAGAPLVSSPVVTSDTIYQSVPETGVVAIDKNAGQFNRKPKWIVRDATEFLSEDATHVYLRQQDDRIVAVDKETGKTLFTSQNRFDVFARNEKDATIYAANHDGQVMAINPALEAGQVGTIVMAAPRLQPLAMRYQPR